MATNVVAKIPGDLTKIKTKIAFGLTKRQLICFGLAAVIGIPIYFLTKDFLGTDISVFLMMIIMLPFFFMGMYSKNGQPAEKILKNYIDARILRPKIRIYSPYNPFSEMTKEVRPSGTKTIQSAKTANKQGKAIVISSQQKKGSKQTIPKKQKHHQHSRE